ncbi:Acyltransferase [Anaerobium acetethylicum]|uniref:Acyltransferase n=2 Tax=Anaerobium acetethylicum TaxID=1619234 RepID=A0A1D3TNN4_9FIRM|nr:Acyltransferase [Anaerobium acetethylicum]
MHSIFNLFSDNTTVFHTFQNNIKRLEVKRMNNMKHHPAAWLIRKIMKKPEITGLDNIASGVPAFFVSNHVGYYAPVKLLVFTDLKLIPWVAHELTERKYCRRYLKTAFFETALNLKSPLSTIAAALISPACVAIMRYIGAIPVFRKSRSIILTIDMTVKNLEKGNNILVFPEISGQPLNDVICRFDSGFINLARVYYEQTNKNMVFYPVCVNRTTNRISIGSRITFDPDKKFHSEKQRIIEGLTGSITAMYDSK